MPFGATVAGDVFQRMLDECFGKLKQVIIIADEIMVVGYKLDHSDHNQAFTSLLQTAQKCNVKLNYDKLQYKHNEIDFFGETYTISGHKPARSKVSAITAMPSPTNKKQVQSFIDMINYLSKFSLRLSELAEPIRELSKDKVPFNWGLEHQAAFTQMKQEILSAAMLAYYSPKKQTLLWKDASIKGIGAYLLQEEKPIYFASKAITETQKDYVATDRIACNGLGNEEIPSFSIRQSFYLRNWPETALGYIIEEFKPSNSTITADTNQDSCLPLYSKIHTWCYKAACRLFIQIRWSKRYHQTTKAAHTSDY